MVNNRQDLPPAGDAAGGNEGGSESGNVEFTKEEVEALLNEKPKAKKFDLKVIGVSFFAVVLLVFYVLDWFLMMLVMLL